MAERIRIGAHKWRDVIALVSIFVGLLIVIATSNRSFGQHDTMITVLDQQQKILSLKQERTQTFIEQQTAINKSVLAGLESLEKGRIENQIEIIRLLKKNKMLPHHMEESK